MELHYIGGRRPKSLEDQNQYQESVNRPKAKPVAHRDTESDGAFLGAGPRRADARNKRGKR